MTSKRITQYTEIIVDTLSATKHQSGQVIIFLLLLMAVGLTIGLTVISSSTSDVAISSKVEREAAVYSANEAVVEKILKTPANPQSSQTIDNVDVTTTVPTLGAGAVYAFPNNPIPAGETQTLWLIGHQATTGFPVDESSTAYTASTMDICWGIDPSSTNTNVPGIIATLLYKNTSGNYAVSRKAYRERVGSPPASCGTPGAYPDDCFVGISGSGSTANCGSAAAYPYWKTLTFAAAADFGVDPAANKLISLRIQPVYNTIKLAVRPADLATFPPQAIIDAFVSAKHQFGSESSKVHIFRSYPLPIALFDYALFSGASITH